MFYFLNIIIAVYNALLFSIFRDGIYDYLRLSKMSETSIRKLGSGFANHWLYRSIKKRLPPVLYYVNLIFLSYTVLFSFFVFFFGFMQKLQPIIFVLSAGLCIIEIPAIIAASIYTCRREFGKPFVLLVWSKERKRLFCSPVDMLSWGLTLLLIFLSFRQL